MKLVQVLLLMLSLAASGAVQATVSLSGTRLVFDGRFTDVSIEARNQGRQEVLLQAWLEARDDSGARSNDLPFVLTPPISRLAPDGRQALRLMYEGRGMPTDHESLLHLYVMEIPRTRPGDGQLSIAIRQRINVLFRPPGLAGDPALTPERLRWVLEPDASGVPRLKVENPTTFHAALLSLELAGEQGSQPLGDDLLVPPGEHREVLLATRTLATRQRLLRFNALTDYGGQRVYSARFDVGIPFSASLVGDASSLAERTSP
ncbi:fimbrial biogenesis chaperone [Pseudomonas gingeri]|uniref:Molecular chaperone n=1 Tax=Pseudomonas gingeri TaxID=117681 RepID=A0A7Y7YG33_9PSED|nr:molecular chaperone [Pseudomonas gingeri]NWA01340.1 molecular chaperone [Pseudomonas gingeri]NWA13857.1 molecular chaperone [Pseudomonas gingeri]NWA52783.1 molecular chaperone [Pseudomonas gingeri]NWA96280.1 molecular chaperone [Pseudomonas gingeri]NWB00084.1 molecular chaperone [Pseudomonas gingeri]